VRLLLVRHGLSCANIIGKYGSNAYAKMQHKNFLDPPLSDCGRGKTEAAAAILKSQHVDYVISSSMSRAIETAWVQFGRREVHVIPHIGEEHRGFAATAVAVGHGLGLIHDRDNTPMAEEEQLAMLRGYYPDIKVDYRLRNDTADKLHSSDWNAFEEFLAKRLLPELEAKDPKDRYTLGVGTHSLFLRYSIGRRAESTSILWKETRTERQKICVGEMPPDAKGNPGKPYNNQILEIYYDYNPATGLTLDPSPGCRTLGSTEDNRYGVGGMPKQLCQSDFALCVPVWQKQMDKPQRNKTAAKGSRISGPAECETFYMCDHFPQIDSVEQEWTDEWLNVNMDCMRTASANCVALGRGSELPEYPDTSSPEVCTCTR